MKERDPLVVARDNLSEIRDQLICFTGVILRFPGIDKKLWSLMMISVVYGQDDAIINQVSPEKIKRGMDVINEKVEDDVRERAVKKAKTLGFSPQVGIEVVNPHIMRARTIQYGLRKKEGEKIVTENVIFVPPKRAFHPVSHAPI